MSTPRTDAEEFFARTDTDTWIVTRVTFSRELERELSEAKARLDFLKSQGITVGEIQTSSEPEARFACVIQKDSELCRIMPKIITKYGNGHVHVSVKGEAIEIAWENTGENITVRPVTRISFEEIFSPLREARVPDDSVNQ